MIVTEIGSGQTGGIGQKEKTYNRVFRVIADNYQQGTVTVCAAVGVPLWSVYATTLEADLSALCERLSATRDDANWLVWTVTAEYTTTPPPENERNEQETPALDRAAKFSFSAASYEVASSKNRQGYIDFVTYEGDVETLVTTTFTSGILNTAGDPLTGLTQEESRPIIHVSKNMPSYDPVQASQYVNAVNVDNWLGLEPRKAKLKRWDCGNPQTENGQTFVTWEMDFEVKFDTWDEVRENKGYRMRPAAGQPAVDFDPDTGQKPSDPVYLDADGVKLAQDAPIVFVKYRVAKEVSFNALNLL